MPYYKKYKGRMLGPYQNKHREHFFTAKDVARLAKHVADKDGGYIAVLAAVAVALGLGWIFCSASRAIRSALSILTFVKEIALFLATSKLISVIIEVLLQAKVIAPSWVKALLAIAVSALVFIKDLFSAVDNIANDMELLHETAKVIDDICTKIQEDLGNAVDYTCDANSEECERAKKLSEDAAFQLKSDAEKAFEILGVERYPNWWEYL